MSKYVIGLDYGTDSVRSLIVDASNGKEMASTAYEYKRWKEGKYCDPTKNQFRQHPLDYIEGLEKTIKDALLKCPPDVANNIAGISVDTTGSTPVAVDKAGTPLALLESFAKNPNAMFILWKDHTAIVEAEEINNLARSWGGVDYTKYVGGIYSSEWFWAKILHTIRQDKQVAEAAFSWVEHCDWIPALLTGQTDPLQIKRSRCAAGHKAMWHPDFDGLPSIEFLNKLDPALNSIRERMFQNTYTCDNQVGKISNEWAQKLGINNDAIIGVGAFDAHLGALGAEIKPYYLSKVMGTSTCDMLVAPANEVSTKLIRGICGQVDGSIVPGMIGLEAGQSAFGDIYAWFKQVLMWPAESILANTSIVDAQTRQKLVNEMSEKLIAHISDAAAKLPVDETGIVALDWMNGRRTPDANQLLKGVVSGINLGSNAPLIFKALVEATAFGAKKIIDRFIDEGIRIDGVIALGGVAKKSTFVMQTVCDVINMPILVARSEQACALGAAMAAAVAAGLYPSVENAQQAMGSGYEKEYVPNAHNAQLYATLYKKYNQMGEFFESFYSNYKQS